MSDTLLVDEVEEAIGKLPARNRRYPDDVEKAALADYLAGVPLPILRERYGMSAATIQSIRKRAGLRPRSFRTETPRFIKLAIPESLYVATIQLAKKRGTKMVNTLFREALKRFIEQQTSEKENT